MRRGVFKDARQSAVWFPNGHSHILIKTHKPDRLTQQILTVHTLHDRYAKASVTPKCVSHIVFNCLKIMSCIFDSQPCSVLAAEVSSVYNIDKKMKNIYFFLKSISLLQWKTVQCKNVMSKKLFYFNIFFYLCFQFTLVLHCFVFLVFLRELSSFWSHFNAFCSCKLETDCKGFKF